MPTLFTLEILTPEHPFFNEEVEAIRITAPDGEMTVLARHAPLVAPLGVGVLTIKQNGVWREAFHAEGFLEVLHDGVFVFTQSCEWPENIDVRRAEEARRRAEEELRQQQSLREFKMTQIALTRAMERLRVTRSNSLKKR